MRRTGIASCLSVGIALGLSPLAAQTGGPAILRDIATPGTFVWPSLLLGTVQFVPLQGFAYFFAWEANRGQELWRSDGTAEGTAAVGDICPGSCTGTSSVELVESGGVLYFAADDGAHGEELWRSDGTAAGTSMVADITPGSGTSLPKFLTPAPGGLYFTARDGVHGAELWWSDGTEAGTRLVVDLLLGGPTAADSVGPTHLVMLGSTLMFTANDGVHGRELWRTDGSAGGTELVKDTVPGSGAGFHDIQPWPFGWDRPAVAGGKLFFAAASGDWQLPWVSDGTSTGTFPLVTPEPFSDWYATRFFGFDDVVLFSGGDFPLTLWRSDGTPGGTYPLGTAENGGENLNPPFLARLGPHVYFPGFQPATGRELWATDGTVVGTQLLADVRPGADSGLEWAFSIFTAAGGRLFFPADDGVHGTELWSTDGSLNGASMVADLQPGAASSLYPLDFPSYPVAVGETLLYRSVSTVGLALSSLDLQAGTIDSVQDTGGRPGSLPFCGLRNCPSIAATPKGAAFAALDRLHGVEPWESDGAPAGTELVADLRPGIEWSVPAGPLRAFASLPGKLLAVARDADDRSQVWSMEAGVATQLTAELWDTNSGITELLEWKGAAYFTTTLGLWRTDGTVPGTSQLVSGFTRRPTPAGARLYFSDEGRLWSTDGSVTGTHRVAPAIDVVPAQAVATVDAHGRERLYFAGFDDVNGGALWTTDGTDGGTQLVVDVQPGAGGSFPALDDSFNREPPILAALGGRILFVADDGASGEELWVSDGTTGNATLVEIRPGPQGSNPRRLTVVDGRVYFVADDGTHGVELWVSDGKPGGTQLARDVRPGPEGSAPQEIVVWRGSLVFAADDGVHGMELWYADPTGAGAQLLLDLWPGIDPSSPQALTVSNERLFFFADDGVHGLEPWAWSAGAGLFTDGFETGATGRWTGGTWSSD